LRLIHGALFSREIRLRAKWLLAVLVAWRLVLSTLGTKLPSGLFTACLPAWRLMEGGPAWIAFGPIRAEAVAGLGGKRASCRGV
jgi:hypothetical protein